MLRRPDAAASDRPLRAASRAGRGRGVARLPPPAGARPRPPRLDVDRIDITGRQNLTLGSGARAYGMGGAFLARADDATAASWNPAGLSYLRVPGAVARRRVELVRRHARASSSDSFEGQGGRLRRLHLAGRPRRHARRGPAELPAGHLLRRPPPDRAVRPDDAACSQQIEDGSERRRVRRGRVRHGPSPEPPRARRVHGEPLAERLRPDPRRARSSTTTSARCASSTSTSARAAGASTSA